jgi:hypothetical protein
MPDTKSVRVQLREDTKERLKELASQFNCTYGGEASLTALLSDIASGQLQLVSLNNTKKQSSDGLIIQISIVLPFYFSGIIYLVSKSIADNNGNIYELNTHEIVNSDDNQKGLINILVHVAEIEYMKKILGDLQLITLDSLYDFNKDKIEYIKSLESHYYRKLKQSNQHMVGDSGTNEKLQAKLIIDIRCTLGVGIMVENKVGIAYEITGKIADLNILISHMNVRRDLENKEISHIEMYLFFQSFSTEEAVKGIESINSIKKTIKKMTGVKEVKDLDMMIFQPSVISR